MFEIYQRHADRYQELVSAEDYQGNLRKHLLELLNWDGAAVLEAGAGTGRVTQLYIERVASALCCDASLHMLDFAKENLEDIEGKITYMAADNRDLPVMEEPFDVFVEGWSFGHCLSDCRDAREISTVGDDLVQNAMKNLKGGGSAILIETLGTNTDGPGAPKETLRLFYEELEKRHGFRREVLRTDYRFASVEDALRIMTFFFGEQMGEGVERRGSRVIPEWTGVWTQRTAT